MDPEIKDISRVRNIVSIMEPLSHLNESTIAEKLVESGALLEGHWELLSGKHTSVFLKFRLIAEKCNNGFLEEIAQELTEKFKDQRVDVIVGRATAGSLLVDKVSTRLRAVIPNVQGALAKVEKSGRPIPELLTGKIKKGDNVLIIDDLTTTGEGLKRLIKLVESKKANVVGIGLFAARDEAPLEQLRSKGINLHVLIKLNVENVDKPSCQLCRKRAKVEYSHDHM